MIRFGRVLNRARFIEGLVLALVAAIVVCFVLLIPALGKLNRTVNDNEAAAKAGQQAHTRQCLVLPIGTKLYTAALHRGDITIDDFRLIKSSVAALGCSAQQTSSAQSVK